MNVLRIQLEYELFFFRDTNDVFIQFSVYHFSNFSNSNTARLSYYSGTFNFIVIR